MIYVLKNSAPGETFGVERSENIFVAFRFSRKQQKNFPNFYPSL